MFFQSYLDSSKQKKNNNNFMENVLLRYNKNVLRTACFRFLYVNTASSSICPQLTMHKGHSTINVLKLSLCLSM